MFAGPSKRAVSFEAASFTGVLELNRDNMISGVWRVATVRTVAIAPEFEHREHCQACFFHAFLGGFSASALVGICWNRTSSKGDGQ